jgi:uncharacterized membrane protein YoaK (UPF0700 family)
MCVARPRHGLLHAMPTDFLHRLTAPQRTRRANRQLGSVLAFVAGAVNAGGFLAVQRYTSHMSGIVSGIADDLVLGQVALALGGVSLLLAFVAGAATTAMQIHWARRQGLQGEFALPLMTEAVLLLLFGLLGANLELLVDIFVPSTVLLLCFVMGLQNAVVTKISQAEIRTTHMTGVITDLGIELGRLFYWNRRPDADAGHAVLANRDKLGIHATILAMFFGGGLLGAVAFKRLGFVATLPIAGLLMVMAAPPLLRDLWTRRPAP